MNLENKTVAELRKIAADNQVRFEQGTKKKDMINTLEHYMQKIQSQNDEEALFEDEGGLRGLQDGLGGTDHIDELHNPDVPSFSSSEWNDYVMSHFRSDELIDGNPITAGLRRVAELLLGDVIESGPVQVFPSEDGNGPGRATVVYRVVFDWMHTGMTRAFSEVADVWHGNTDDLFCAHPVATASTRAEGRALRKALKIRVVAAEELAKKDIVAVVKQTVSVSTDGNYDPDDRVSLQQISFIDNKCEKLNIDLLSFINIGENDYRSINDVTRDSAKKMIRVLNEYQNDTELISDGITGYQKDWRN